MQYYVLSQVLWRALELSFVALVIVGLVSAFRRRPPDGHGRTPARGSK
jgi:hypothetical protein